MKNINERPSTLPAACAQVLDVPAPLAAAAAHAVVVGNRAVRSGPSVGTPRLQPRWTQLKGRSVRAYGAIGFTVLNGTAQQGISMVVKAVDVVGGVPPRGRPV